MQFKQRSLHHAPESKQTCKNCNQLNMSKIAKLCHCNKAKVQATCLLNVNKIDSLSTWSLMRSRRSLSGRPLLLKIHSTGADVARWPVRRKVSQTAS